MIICIERSKCFWIQVEHLIEIIKNSFTCYILALKLNLNDISWDKHKNTLESLYNIGTNISSLVQTDKKI